MESEQYAHSSEFPVAIHQIGHFGHDRAMDLCRNGIFHILLAQRGKHLPPPVTKAAVVMARVGSLYVQHQLPWVSRFCFISKVI